MKEKPEQLITASLIYEEIILSVEETTSGSRCGSSLAAFSRLASACSYDRVSQGVFSIFGKTSYKKSRGKSEKMKGTMWNN